MNKIINSFEYNPIIAAARDKESIEYAVNTNVNAVFILSADIFNIKEYIKLIKSAGKLAFVHIDFLEGVGKDRKAVEYIARNIKPDGILSTRTNLIKYAKDEGLFAIQRFFMVDSQSYETLIKSISHLKPDMIEVMPALMPEIIKKLSLDTNIPIIAGGLISTKEHIMEILASGALAASAGKKQLWNLE